MHGDKYFVISTVLFRQDLKRCKTLTTACMEKLSLMVKRYQQQKSGYLETLKVGCHFYSEVNDLSKMS